MGSLLVSSQLTGQMVIAMWVAHRLPWQEGQIIWGDVARVRTQPPSSVAFQSNACRYPCVVDDPVCR